MVLANIAFRHLKLNLNIKPPGKLTPEKTSDIKIFELIFLYEHASKVIQEFTLIAYRILNKQQNKIVSIVQINISELILT